ncbi:hypothetical protein PAECIP111893_00288 [Paenibacillus plantiphilus]|uniref:Replicative helicase inhibitor G39P N-terminal domain-containing protein n=1 Tax=Paenibacillus plantiphilus TaxID=2905650 RepID=A0ABM9BM39_9BACL|nr:hypothetical protein [Paenibacillus plantiphilus]CAH1190350.1 hypothetical protein PAECIP111893_00288 [Paenibacillus plantiphilus]
MEVIEIAELYKHIKKHFPFFDASLAKVKEDHKYLKHFPADAARTNIDQHILTETVTPGIAHIRGRLGDQLDSQRSKRQAEEYDAQLNEWSEIDSPPPEGYWERTRKLLRGDMT